MNLKPLADRIIIKPLESVEKTAGGIVLPDSSKEKPQEGKVVAVGKGKVSSEGKLQPVEVKVGDVVLYGKYSGNEITSNGEEYLIIREEDVLAVVGK